MIEANHAHGLQASTQRSGEPREDGVKLPFERIAPNHSCAVSGYPYAPAGTELNIGDEGVCQASRVGARLTKVLERVTVEAIETVLGAEPHKPRRILRDSQHRLLRKAVVDPETFESHRRGRRGLVKNASGRDEYRG
jgi:hypothetical protein